MVFVDKQMLMTVNIEIKFILLQNRQIVTNDLIEILVVGTPHREVLHCTFPQHARIFFPFLSCLQNKIILHVPVLLHLVCAFVKIGHVVNEWLRRVEGVIGANHQARVHKQQTQFLVISDIVFFLIEQRFKFPVRVLRT